MVDDGDTDKLQRELKQIHNLISEYQQEQLRQSEISRVENTQLLISIAIVGAAITFYVRNEIPQGPFGYLFYIIWVSATSYILLKALVSPLNKDLDNRLLLKIDRHWLQSLFALPVLMSVIAGLLFVVVERYPYIESQLPSVSLLASIISLMVTISILYVYNREAAAMAKQDIRRGFLIEILNNRASPKEVKLYFARNPKILDPDFDYLQMGAGHPFDFVAERGEEKVGVEIKLHHVGIEEINELIRRGAESDFVDRVLLVASTVSSPARDRIDGSNVIELYELGEEAIRKTRDVSQ